MNAPLLGLSSRAFTVVCRVGNNQLSSINLDIAILKKPQISHWRSVKFHHIPRKLRMDIPDPFYSLCDNSKICGDFYASYRPLTEMKMKSKYCSIMVRSTRCYPLRFFLLFFDKYLRSGLLVQWHDSRSGCERSRVRLPDRPSTYYFT